jgi:hypothetical protein
MLMLKEIESTAPVEIAVEISLRLWKTPPLIKFSTFPQAIFYSSCGNVENSDLIEIYKELN